MLCGVSFHTPCAPPVPLNRPAAVGVFSLLLGVYALTNPGLVNAVDTWPTIAEAAAIVECGSLRLSDLDPAAVGADARTVSARYPANKYGPGLHLAYVPAWLAARTLGRLTGLPPFSAAKVTFSFVNAAAGAFAGLFLLLALRQAGFRTGTAVAVTLATGPGSFLWPLTGISYSDPLQTALVAAVLWRAYAACRSPGSVNLHALGLAASLAVSAKFANAPLVACMSAIALANPAARRRLPIVAVPWAAALLGALALVNHARFGSPLATGYGAVEMFEVPPASGSVQLLVSFERGFFWYFPLLPASIVGLFYCMRRTRAQAAVLLTAVAVHFLLCLSYYDRHGGNCLGPRYFAVLLPSLGVGLAALFEALRPPRLLTAGLLAACTLWILPMALLQWFLPQVVRDSVVAAGGNPTREPVPLTAARLLAAKSLRGPESIALAAFSRTRVDGHLVLDAPDNRGWQPWWMKDHDLSPPAARALGAALLAALAMAGAVLLLRSSRTGGQGCRSLEESPGRPPTAA